jgi:hypothetical protein
MDHLPFLLADPDFYRPIEEAAETGTRYESCALPADWQHVPKAVWNVCLPPGGIAATHGWKVHVSATLERAQPVLSAASAVCVAHGVPFEYLDNELFYTWLHHRHGARAQSGTFIAAYPPHQEAARRLMTALAAALDGESGPYILGDRRYGGSTAVGYRYGAFVEIPRLLPDGTTEHLVPDGRGRLVPDPRGVSFTLPEAIVDPFVEDRLPPRADERVPGPRDGAADIGGRGPVRANGEVSFEGFTFTRLIRHSNGGGAYVARRESDGCDVFVKEAHGPGGLHFDRSTALTRLTREYRTLCELDRKRPGIAPKPVAFLTRWEHTFLITESIPGEPLPRWVLGNIPGIRTDVDHDRKIDYHRRCLNIFADLRTQIDALHDAGHVFVDLSAENVLVTDDDTVRLVGFAAARRIGESPSPLGAPGYFPNRPRQAHAERPGADPRHFDDYGMSGIARLLIFGPLHHVLDREPGAMTHLLHHLWQDDGARPAPVPERLWQAATRFAAPPRPATLPTPEEVADDPVGRLRELRDRTADALEAMASPGAEPVYPTTRFGYATNLRCVAHGTAGVVHALRVAGRATDPGVLRRLTRDSLRHRRNTPPGLHTGNAGIAWVLADHGLIDEANRLLTAASGHPVLECSAGLAEGTAGVALAHLALYGHDHDERHLDEALRLRAHIPDDASLAALLGGADATGLLYGRAGIALLDHYLYRLGLDDRALRRGLELLRAELAFAVPYPHRGIGFPVSATDRRTVIHLARGSAGFATVAARYPADADEELARAVTDALVTTGTAFTDCAGLYDGRAGHVLALAEHARLTGGAQSGRRAVRAARKLYCHAVAHPTGVRFLGEGFARFSADLASGSAGMLLALTRLLDDRDDAFFTLDRLTPLPTAACTAP